MKTFLNASILGAAALLFAGAARAELVDFETLDLSSAPFAPLLAGGDMLTQGTSFVHMVDPANPDGGTLVGALMSGADADSCVDQTCPTGNPTSYLGSLNGGVVHFGLTGAASTLLGFDAALLAPANSGLPAGLVAYLAIDGARSDGSHALALFGLNGPATATGRTGFASFLTADTPLVGAFTDFRASAYLCDGGSCSPSSAAAQFALDNLQLAVSAVPEPAHWLLLAAGLGAIALRRRRTV